MITTILYLIKFQKELDLKLTLGVIIMDIITLGGKFYEQTVYNLPHDDFA